MQHAPPARPLWIAGTQQLSEERAQTRRAFAATSEGANIIVGSNRCSSLASTALATRPDPHLQPERLPLGAAIPVIVGLSFVLDLRRIVGEPSPIRPDEIPDQGGIALFGRRVALKLSAAELARRSGVAKSTIARLERGELTVSRDTWERIEAALAAAERERAE